MFLSILLACAPADTDDGKPDLGDPVRTIPADDPGLGTWDGQVYLTRMSAMDDGDEPGQWAPFAVGEVYDAARTLPLGGGLPTLEEGCWREDTPASRPDLVDVGHTLPLDVGPRTFALERDEGYGDYWWEFGTDLACDCDVGTAVALPDTDGEVLVPGPVVLDADFASAWASFEDTGTLDLRWAPADDGSRVGLTLWHEATGTSAVCFLDDDGAARLEFARADGTPDVVVDRVASRVVAHPTYGTVQLTVRDSFFPLVETP
ncbi:MAG: hypothetical protein ACK4YP_20765 [Myxococcota bacterium]